MDITEFAKISKTSCFKVVLFKPFQDSGFYLNLADSYQGHELVCDYIVYIDKDSARR